MRPREATLREYLLSILHSVTKPLLALASPGQRVFVPYLIGAALLSTIVWVARLRKKTSLLSFLFPRRIWFHPSSLLDYKLAFARAVIDAAIFAPIAVTSLGAAHVVSRWLFATFGAAPAMGVRPAIIVALFTLGALVAEDFARYLVHLAAHRVPVLWEFHKLHHSAEVMTPFTVHRTHPIEGMVMRSGAALAVGVIAGVFVWAFPGKVSGWQILGVDALGFVWNATISNLRHSHVWISFGRFGEHLFISPAQHQIHHSDRIEHYHKNMGSTFALWDWMFGTLYVTKGFERLQFGLPPSERNHGNSVWSAVMDPIFAALRLLVPARTAPASREAREPDPGRTIAG
ncbi:MAG: sterol desaturase family protein [Deltaproteobacteria bacterium]|nr:sterol desaturase family protein [Deltaproteobacteria bacterium]